MGEMLPIMFRCRRCGAVVLAIRAQHSRRLESIEAERQEREAIASMTTIEITQKYPITERTARLWREKARNNGWH